MKNKMFFWIDFLRSWNKVNDIINKEKKGTFGSQESFQRIFSAFWGTKLCPLPLANILPLVHLGLGEG